jgi:two-component system, OmpR family, response regulator
VGEREYTLGVGSGRPVVAVSTAVGTIELDLQRFRVSAAGQVVNLTRLEFDLLAYLVRNAPRVISQRELFENVVQTQQHLGSSLIRVHVAHLRQKLGEMRAAITTVRGRGFCVDSMTDDDRDSESMKSSALS